MNKNKNNKTFIIIIGLLVLIVGALSFIIIRDNYHDNKYIIKSATIFGKKIKLDKETTYYQIDIDQAKVSKVSGGCSNPWIFKVDKDVELIGVIRAVNGESNAYARMELSYKENGKAHTKVYYFDVDSAKPIIVDEDCDISK